MHIVELKVTDRNTRITFHTQCTHCGNESALNPAGDALAPGRDDAESYYVLCRCLNCDKLSLIRVNGAFADEEDGELQDLIDENVEQVWPVVTFLDVDAPERVKTLYQEAQKVVRFPSPFVVQIGRALEAVVKDRNAQGKTLNDKINWLIEQNELPRVFGEMAHINRIIRNWGAHDLEINVEHEDVEIVDEFFRAIIEYLYVAPARVRKVQSLLDARQKRSS